MTYTQTSRHQDSKYSHDICTSSTTDPTFPTVGLDIAEGRNHLTGKTMAAFRYIYENHFHEADWFMKVSNKLSIILALTSDIYSFRPQKKYLTEYNSI